MNPQRDTVDIGEAVGVLRRRWRWVAAGVLTGLVIAVVVGFVFGPRYKGRTTVVLRSAQAGQGGTLGGEASGILSAGSLVSLLSGATGFDTELEILTSRSTVGAVVDSLGLQAIVEAPKALPRTALFSSAHWDPLALGGVYHFERSGSEYRVSGPGAGGPARPGSVYHLGRSILTLRAEGLPERFVVRLISR
ncbi:MAG TPA: Wzz/FepE/Etk N-terminal domain-containing protein, partial [Longimicrobiaceae bacterium]|nr:Wzz/FepE/Etk N-terminal domain-containing protein [Longimicrobiaceae bacterium]